MTVSDKTHIRQSEIMNRLGTIAECSVPELVRLTGASEATVRRDLLEMEKQGMLLRTFGGARRVEKQSLVLRTFDQRSSHCREAKEWIAEAAVKLVSPGMTLVIDSGTTCWNFAACLRSFAPLRIVTSALAVVEALGGTPGIELNLVGGCFRIDNLDFIGPLALENLRSFHADIAFMGCDSLIPGRGAFAEDVNTAAVSREMARCAERTVILCDRSKFRNCGCHRLFAPDEIDTVVTDGPAAEFSNEPFRVIFPQSGSRGTKKNSASKE